MRFLYDIILHFYALYALMAALLQGKPLKPLLAKISAPSIKIENEERGRVWIHAVSLGEMRAVVPLANQIQKEGYDLFVSTATKAGLEEAQKSLPKARAHFFLPFDFSYIIDPFVQKLSPDLLILSETDYWLNLHHSVKKYGGRIAVVNGKISERSMGRLLKFKNFSTKLFSDIDLFALQSEDYAKRFARLGVEGDRCFVTGNLKFDRQIPAMNDQERYEMKERFHLQANDLVLTLGSTHDPEESLWLDCLGQLWSHFPHLKVFLVPRHMARVDEIERVLQRKNIAFSRSTKGGNFSIGKVVLVDEMGKLLNFYQLSDLAFVGGTFAEHVGGHNITEPAFFGVPAIYGPFLHSQPELAKLMDEYKAGIGLDQKELYEKTFELLKDRELRQEMGERGRKLVEASRGALEKTWKRVKELV